MISPHNGPALPENLRKEKSVNNQNSVSLPAQLYTITVKVLCEDGGELKLWAAEAESKEKNGVWDPKPELTITSPYVYSRVDSNTFTMDNLIRQSRP